MVEQVSSFKINFKSSIPFLDFTGQSPEMYKKLIIENSMFDFFPYAEAYIQDKSGLMINNAYFIESLDFDISIEDQRDNSKLGHTFVWSENQMLDTSPNTYISGDNIFILISKYDRKNRKKRKMYSGKISDIVKEIVTDEFEIDSSDIYIDETFGELTETRNNETASEFIQRLAEHAYSKNFKKSPYVSFITTNGEFYFKALENLFRFSEIVGSYSFMFNAEATTDSSSIQKYELNSGGMPVNKDNYIKEIAYLDDTGEFSQETKYLQDFIIQDQSKRSIVSKFPIVKSFVNDKVCDEDFFGLLLTNEDTNYYKGYVNNLFLDSLLSHRMNIVVHHNKNLIAGKKIELTVDEDYNAETQSKTFSGEWLILEDSHYIDKDLTPYSQLTLVRCGLNLNTNNRFNKRFI